MEGGYVVPAGDGGSNAQATRAVATRRMSNLNMTIQEQIIKNGIRLGRDLPRELTENSLKKT